MGITKGWQRWPAVAAIALTGVLAACGGSSGPASSSPTPSQSSSTPAAPSGSSTGAPAGAKGQIIANWTAFFNPKTPVATRVKLLQNGQLFAPIIEAQAKSSLAQGASAKVHGVVLTSATQATVSYDIVFNGTPALPNQQGQAVLQGGVWKVGDTSFCGLLRLESQGSGKGLPAACKAV
jgi:hypothetical protein